MDNRNWPTVPKILSPDYHVSHSWYADGKEYIDCFTDVGASPISNDQLYAWIVDGVSDGIAIRKPHIFHDTFRDDEYPMLLGERLNLPSPSVFYSNSGTEAVEAAIKLARRATGRQIVLGIKGDFHGRTYGALSLSYDDPPYHFDGFEPFVPGIFPVDERQATVLVGGSAIEDPTAPMAYNNAVYGERVAALVVSPVNGNNTLKDWPAWVWELAEMIQRRGGLLIFDEVQTGFGRAGGSVSITQTDYGRALPAPDVYIFGKAAGAGWPFSMTIAAEPLVRESMGLGTHFNTMAGSPMGCYLSYRYLKWLEGGGLDVMLRRADQLAERYAALHRIGYMMGITVGDPHEFVRIGLEHGLMMMTARHNEPIRFSPAPTLQDTFWDKIVAGLDRTFAAYDNAEYGAG